jgi:hypothetical protein
MQAECYRRGQGERGTINLEAGISSAFEDEATPDLRRVVMGGGERSHGCDGCGGVTPDVDLWAEDSETGEELWLCVACGEW